MKKLFIPILAFVPIGANAITLAGCTSATCPTSSTAVVYEVPNPSCDSYTTNCLYNSATGYYLRYRTCNSCDSPYESITEQISSFAAFTTVCGDTFNLTTRTNCNCGTQCDSCGSLSSGVWTSPKTGYQSTVVYSCGISTSCECTSSIKYRCAAGYYGTPSYSQLTGYSGCTRCPSSGGVYGTSAAGSTEITSCYMPSGTSMTDDVGTYEYTSNCYYTE